jgi:GNAT superfamily N-acetyltransferase
MNPKTLKTFLNEAAVKLTLGGNNDLKKNQAFVRKMYSMATPNPLGNNYYFQLNKGKESATILFELHAMNWGVIIDSLVVAEDKGRKGFGNHILTKITDQADKDGIELTLSAVPLAHAGKKIPKGKLVAFYKKHGFKKSGGDQMFRAPK